LIEIHIKREISELNIFVNFIHNISCLNITFVLIVKSYIKTLKVKSENFTNLIDRKRMSNLFGSFKIN